MRVRVREDEFEFFQVRKLRPKIYLCLIMFCSTDTFYWLIHRLMMTVTWRMGKTRLPSICFQVLTTRSILIGIRFGIYVQRIGENQRCWPIFPFDSLKLIKHTNIHKWMNKQFSKTSSPDPAQIFLIIKWKTVTFGPHFKFILMSRIPWNLHFFTRSCENTFVRWDAEKMNMLRPLNVNLKPLKLSLCQY